MNACLAGDTQTGRADLRDLVNATVGFEELAKLLRHRQRAAEKDACKAAGDGQGGM